MYHLLFAGYDDSSNDGERERTGYDNRTNSGMQHVRHSNATHNPRDRNNFFVNRKHIIFQHHFSKAVFPAAAELYRSASATIYTLPDCLTGACKIFPFKLYNTAPSSAKTTKVGGSTSASIFTTAKPANAIFYY